jgi:YD repeat-containing protein
MVYCSYRLFDRYNRRVANLAVLGDDDPAWRPHEFGYDLFDCRVSLALPDRGRSDPQQR